MRPSPGKVLLGRRLQLGATAWEAYGVPSGAPSVGALASSRWALKYLLHGPNLPGAFDLAADPWETSSILVQKDGIRRLGAGPRVLREKLRARRREIQARFEPREEKELDAAEAEMLESLGYL